MARHLVRRHADPAGSSPRSAHRSRLGAYDAGEIRGAHVWAASGGYLRQVGRLPDFLGGPVFAGAWLENGDAFDDWRDTTWRSNGGAGVVDTIIGLDDARRVVELRRAVAHLRQYRTHVPVRLLL